MKKVLLCFILLGLCGCEEEQKQFTLTAPDGRVIVVTGNKEPTEQDKKDIFAALPKQKTLEERKRDFENRMFNLCQNRFDQDHAIHYSTQYKNNVCICFAENLTAKVSVSEKEVSAYNSSELYQRKKQEQVFGECADKYKKYKFGL